MACPWTIAIVARILKSLLQWVTYVGVSIFQQVLQPAKPNQLILTFAFAIVGNGEFGGKLRDRVRAKGSITSSRNLKIRCNGKGADHRDRETSAVRCEANNGRARHPGREDMLRLQEWKVGETGQSVYKITFCTCES